MFQSFGDPILKKFNENESNHEYQKYLIDKEIYQNDSYIFQIYNFMFLFKRDEIHKIWFIYQPKIYYELVKKLILIMFSNGNNYDNDNHSDADYIEYITLGSFSPNSHEQGNYQNFEKYYTLDDMKLLCEEYVNIVMNKANELNLI